MQGRVVEFVHSAIPLFFHLRGIFGSSFMLNKLELLLVLVLVSDM
jgi:hypothetical protein